MVREEALAGQNSGEGLTAGDVQMEGGRGGQELPQEVLGGVRRRPAYGEQAPAAGELRRGRSGEDGGARPGCAV